jgi:hypothetical protein
VSAAGLLSPPWARAPNGRWHERQRFNAVAGNRSAAPRSQSNPRRQERSKHLAQWTIVLPYGRSNRTSIGIALRCAKRYQLLPGRRAHNSPLAPDVISASAAQAFKHCSGRPTRVSRYQWRPGDRTYEARANKAQRARGHEDGRARGSNSTKTSESPCTMRVCGLCSFFSLEARILASRFDSSHLAAVQDVRKDRLDLQSVCSSLLQTFCRAGGLLEALGALASPLTTNADPYDADVTMTTRFRRTIQGRVVPAIGNENLEPQLETAK